MTDKITINDVSLAAALYTVGVPFIKFEDDSPPLIKIQSKHGTSYNFFFEAEHDGKPTQDYVNAWFDDSYITDNPEEPFAYIKGFAMNRNTLLDVVKQSASLIILEKGKKTALISSNISDEQRQQILSRL